MATVDQAHSLTPIGNGSRLLTQYSSTLWDTPDTCFDTVLFHGGGPELLDVMAAVARRPGPIVPVHAYATGAREIRSELLLAEKSVSVNTTAAGGNASLMSVG